MQTSRDREIVNWIGRLGAAGAKDVMCRFGMGRSWTYQRLRSLVADGLCQEQRLLHRQPGLYLATSEGLRWCGLQRLGLHKVGAGTFEHTRGIAQVAAALHAPLAGWEVLGEREIRLRESEMGEPFASAVVGELPGGRPALHRPDLALCAPNGLIVAVELELSLKAPRRLRAICTGWARARRVAATYYLADEPVAGAVKRAIRDVRGEDRITVLPRDGVAQLAAAAEGVARHA